MRFLTGKNQFKMVDAILRASGYTTDGLKRISNDSLCVYYGATYVRYDKTIRVDLFHLEDYIAVYCEILPEITDVFGEFALTDRVRFCKADKDTIKWLRTLAREFPR